MRYKSIIKGVFINKGQIFIFYLYIFKKLSSFSPLQTGFPVYIGLLSIFAIVLWLNLSFLQKLAILLVDMSFNFAVVFH